MTYFCMKFTVSELGMRNDLVPTKIRIQRSRSFWIRILILTSVPDVFGPPGSASGPLVTSTDADLDLDPSLF
jgi:hypothetical protein